jgi:hypothetical protein
VAIRRAVQKGAVAKTPGFVELIISAIACPHVAPGFPDFRHQPLCLRSIEHSLGSTADRGGFNHDGTRHVRMQ